MKIGIQTWGTEGDIRPFIALTGGLSAAGREVALAVTEITNHEEEGRQNRRHDAERGWLGHGCGINRAVCRD